MSADSGAIGLVLASLMRAPSARAVAGWTADYVAAGIPFAPKGYDRAGCDCWGLLHLVYRERFGIALPRYDEAYEARLLGPEAGRAARRALAAAIAGRLAPDWRELAYYEAAIGDGILMPIAGQPCHVGIYVGGLHLLHVEDGIDVTCEPVGALRLAARMARSRFFRHRAREAAPC